VLGKLHRKPMKGAFVQTQYKAFHYLPGYQLQMLIKRLLQ
jgi:hypothetical protein